MKTYPTSFLHPNDRSVISSLLLRQVKLLSSKYRLKPQVSTIKKNIGV